MKYLLDTGVFLWSIGPTANLNEHALQVLKDEEHELYLSSASGWEIVIKFATGKLKLPELPEFLIPKSIEEAGIRVLPITLAHVLAVGDLPRHHNDPFDRLLIAQARSEQMVLMTADKLFAQYSVQTLWCAA